MVTGVLLPVDGGKPGYESRSTVRRIGLAFLLADLKTSISREKGKLVMTAPTITTSSGSGVGQKRLYEEQGYLMFPELLDAAEVATLRSALDELLSEARGVTDTSEKFAITTNIDGKPEVRRIFDPIVQHRAFYDVAHHPRILDVLEDLIGPDIQFHHSKLNLKPTSTPGHGSRGTRTIRSFPTPTTIWWRSWSTSTKQPRKTAVCGSFPGATGTVHSPTSSPAMAAPTRRQ